MWRIYVVKFTQQIGTFVFHELLKTIIKRTFEESPFLRLSLVFIKQVVELYCASLDYHDTI